MQKEIYERLEPNEKIEYLSRKISDSIDVDYSQSAWFLLNFGMLAFIALATIHKIYSGYNALKIAIVGFVLIQVLKIISEAYLSIKLDKEFTQKAIKNIENKKIGGK